jgi:hypothetical protein
MSYHQPEGLKLTTPSVSEDTGRFLLLCWQEQETGNSYQS